MPAYHIVLTLEAQRQLSHEMRYSRQRWGKAHQQDFSRSLQAYPAQLAKNPHVHRQRPESFDVRVARWKGLRIVFLLQEDDRCMIIVAFVAETASSRTPCLTL